MLNKANILHHSCQFLNIYTPLYQGKLNTRVYNKRDDLAFSFVNFSTSVGPKLTYLDVSFFFMFLWYIYADTWPKGAYPSILYDNVISKAERLYMTN